MTISAAGIPKASGKQLELKQNTLAETQYTQANFNIFKDNTLL